MMRTLATIVIGLLLAGCGKHYWESRGSDRGLGAFMDDNAGCAAEAKAAKYGIGAEDLYRACMKAHGWRRVQTPSPTDAQYRGPEDVDEFASPPWPLSERGVKPSRPG